MQNIKSIGYVLEPWALNFKLFFAVLKKICVFAMEVYPVIIRDTHGVLSQ